MSLFFRLTTVVTTAVLLRCVPATLVITAPSRVTEDTAGLETREQGPTSWICSALAVESPWTSYANIRGYLEGGNAEKKDYSNMVLYPVMELFHASESRLCVYLPAEDHCYPPAPNTGQVKAVKQLSKRNYYAMRFWGQASDARVQYYKQKLTAALTTLRKAANFDLFFVSFYSDHVREVRYDPSSTTQRSGSEPVTEITVRQTLTCPAGPGYSMSGTTTKVAGQEYLHTTLNESRLSLSDVQTRVVNGSSIQSLDACARAASSGGQNAFSFVSGECRAYDFGKQFCPCAPGNSDLYINTKLLGESKELKSEKLVEENVKKMVIYTEIPLVNRVLRADPYTKANNSKECAEMFGVSYYYTGAFFENNQCYMTEFHDFVSCNQTCRGQPVDAFVRNVNPKPTLHMLSLCGQKIVVTMLDNAPSIYVYVSHAGFGCYRYQEAKTAGGEDCIVTFEKDTKATTLNIFAYGLMLNSEGSTCQDALNIYDDYTTADASLKYSLCSGVQQFDTTKAAITIKFHRGLGSDKNLGFKLLIGSF